MGRKDVARQSGKVILEALQNSMNAESYTAVLRNCRKMEQAKLVHAHAIQTGFREPIELGNQILAIYTKAGHVAEARRYIHQMPQTDAASWTAIITAYSKQGNSREALKTFQKMQEITVSPDDFSLSAVISACAGSRSLKHGQELHQFAVKSCFCVDVYVGSALVDMYAKCRKMEDARQVFEIMPEKNVVTWNSMIAGFGENAQVGEAFGFFRDMPKRNPASWNAMITAYAKNGFLDMACDLFDKMTEPNIVSWNALIAGCVQNEVPQRALQIFKHMIMAAAMKPNVGTLAGFAPALGQLAVLDVVREFHAYLVSRGFADDLVLCNALMDVYCKCRSIEYAVSLFHRMPRKDNFSWNVIISGNVLNGMIDQAEELFSRMPSKDTVTCNVMIGAYAQQNRMDRALELFESVAAERNLVSWNSMISGYSQNSCFKEALDVYKRMKKLAVKPDKVTFSTVLPVCADLAALEFGKEVHQDIINSEFHSDIKILNAVINMYAKCGCVVSARDVFENMSRRDVVTWNTILSAYAIHGYGQDALQFFKRMTDSYVKPNALTFVAVLRACCYSGMVDEGCKYFESMSRDYRIKPSVEHFCCMVDLLGKAGQLDEARDLIEKMTLKPTSAIWVSLLSACKTHQNIEIGAYAAKRLAELEPSNTNIDGLVERWQYIDVKFIENKREDQGSSKLQVSVGLN